MPAEQPPERLSRLSPETIARKAFGTSFRGYDQLEVRAFLNSVSDELREMRDHEAILRSQIEVAESKVELVGDLDEDRLTQVLGAETARVLSTAREAAAGIRSKAEESVAGLLREAEDEASALRSGAYEEVARLRLAADDIHANARAEADGILEDAREQGREMVAKAQAVRERVMQDISRRRTQAKAQLAQVRENHERLLAAYEAARATIAAAEDDLRRALPQAGAAAAPSAEPEAAPADEQEPAPENQPDPPPVLSLVTEPEPEAHAEPEAEVEVDDRVEVEVDEEVGSDDDDADAGQEEPAAEAPSPPVLTLVDAGSQPESEPERPVTPEPEADVEVEVQEEAEEEAEEGAEAGTEVDELFARIRASRAAEVDRAREVLAVEDVPVRVRSPEVESLLERRDAATDEVERRLARRLKRVLSDEQNEALDRLRRSGVRTIDDILPAHAEQAARYARVATADLRSAAGAGAAFLGAAPTDEVETPVEDLASELAGVIVGLLRDRVGRVVGEAAGDPEELADRIRSCYREWKTQRIGDTSRHYVLAAFTRGLFDAAPAGQRLCWVVDDGGSPCPDAEDNALAGALERGEPFPTGHLYPPAHPGCRCLVVPEHL